MLNARRKKLREEIRRVLNLVERCMQLYMKQDEAMQALLKDYGINPPFTKLVWDELEKQNPDFFKVYYERLIVKSQIADFNKLLQLHVQHMQRMHKPPIPLDPNFDVSHTEPWDENQPSHEQEQTEEALTPENMQQFTNSYMPYASPSSGGSSFSANISTVVDMPTQEGMNQVQLIMDPMPGFNTGLSQELFNRPSVGSSCNTNLATIVEMLNQEGIYLAPSKIIPTHGSDMSLRQEMILGPSVGSSFDSKMPTVVDVLNHEGMDLVRPTTIPTPGSNTGLRREMILRPSVGSAFKTYKPTVLDMSSQAGMNQVQPTMSPTPGSNKGLSQGISIRPSAGSSLNTNMPSVVDMSSQDGMNQVRPTMTPSPGSNKGHRQGMSIRTSAGSSLNTSMPNAVDMSTKAGSNQVHPSMIPSPGSNKGHRQGMILEPSVGLSSNTNMPTAIDMSTQARRNQVRAMMIPTSGSNAGLRQGMILKPSVGSSCNTNMSTLFDMSTQAGMNQVRLTMIPTPGYNMGQRQESSDSRSGSNLPMFHPYENVPEARMEEEQVCYSAEEPGNAVNPETSRRHVRSDIPIPLPAAVEMTNIKSGDAHSGSNLPIIRLNGNVSEAAMEQEQVCHPLEESNIPSPLPAAVDMSTHQSRRKEGPPAVPYSQVSITGINPGMIVKYETASPESSPSMSVEDYLLSSPNHSGGNTSVSSCSGVEYKSPLPTDSSGSES